MQLLRQKRADRRIFRIIVSRTGRTEQVMRHQPLDRAPDFTQACIVMFGVNLSWILVALWAIWGLFAAILFALTLNHVMTRIEARVRTRRAVTSPR